VLLKGTVAAERAPTSLFTRLGKKGAASHCPLSNTYPPLVVTATTEQSARHGESVWLSFICYRPPAHTVPTFCPQLQITPVNYSDVL
jgi:hypothetical protein